MASGIIILRNLSCAILMTASIVARAGTFCIEPDGSQLSHEVDFYDFNDPLRLVPAGTVFSNWTEKTECFSDRVDWVKAHDSSADKWINFINYNHESGVGTHGYYLMQPVGDNEQLVYQREYVYEFLPLSNPVSDSQFITFYVVNEDDPRGFDKAPVEYTTVPDNETSAFNYDGGVYRTNHIKLIVETHDGSGFSHYDSASVHLDNSPNTVDHLGPGSYKFEKIASDGEEVWLSTKKK